MQNNTLLAKKTDSKYDVVKLILSIFIIAIHSRIFPTVLYPWLRIAVPLFFVLTSYFLFLKLRNSEPEKHKSIVKAYVLRNVKLYAFWFVVCLPVTLIVRRDEYFANGVLAGAWAFIKGLLVGGTFMSSWFICASVVGVLIVYFLSKKTNQWIVLTISALSYVFCVIDSSYLSVFPQNGIITKIVEVFNKYVNSFHTSFTVSLLWIFIGKCFAEDKLRFHIRWLGIVLLILSCVGLYVEWRLVIPLENSYDNDCYIMLVPVVICLFGCLQMLKPASLKYAQDFRRFSTVTYAFHGSVVAVLDNVLEDFLSFDVSFIVFAVTLVLCIAVYFAIAAVIKKFPNQWFTKLLKNAY